MPTADIPLLIISLILLTLLSALAATWFIRRFTNMELAWKAAVIIGAVNGIVFSTIFWFRN